MLSGQHSTGRQADRRQSDAEKTPHAWWSHFCQQIVYGAFCENPTAAGGESSPKLLFQQLSQGIELFRIERHRKDGSLVRIWLAYLDTHQYVSHSPMLHTVY